MKKLRREDQIQNHYKGWKWSKQDIIHGPGSERFAKYPDGRIDKLKS